MWSSQSRGRIKIQNTLRMCGARVVDRRHCSWSPSFSPAAERQNDGPSGGFPTCSLATPTTAMGFGTLGVLRRAFAILCHDWTGRATFLDGVTSLAPTPNLPANPWVCKRYAVVCILQPVHTKRSLLMLPATRSII